MDNHHVFRGREVLLRDTPVAFLRCPDFDKWCMVIEGKGGEL